MQNKVAPGTKNKVTFVFPAERSTPQFVEHTGGLSLVRADAGLTVTDFVFDLQDATVDVTVPGSVIDAFDLGMLKINQWTVAARRNAIGLAPGPQTWSG